MARPVPCHILLHPKSRNQQLFPLFWVVPIRIARSPNGSIRPLNGRSGRSATTASHAPKPTFAPARRRSGKQSSEQRPVNLERLEIAVAVASASDESDLIWTAGRDFPIENGRNAGG